MAVVHVTGDTFEQEVLKAEGKVLVDFWASWCGPCRMVAPVIEEIANEYSGKVKVCKVNVDEASELASRNAIVSIPTVILFVNGKPVSKLVGAHAFDDYADMIDQYI